MLPYERLLPTETVDTDAPVFETMGFAGVVEYFTGWTLHPNALYSAVKLRRTGHEPGLTPRERESPVELDGIIAQLSSCRKFPRLISPHLKVGVLRRFLDNFRPVSLVPTSALSSAPDTCSANVLSRYVSRRRIYTRAAARVSVYTS
jgi:hypothetical protein